jgi:hypothetical protein
MNIIADSQTQNIRFIHPLLGIFITNLIPIIGVFYAGWSASEVIVTYWIETVVIGFFALLTILISNSKDHIILRIGYAIFFCIHFGMFCTIQGVFIFIGLNGEYKEHIEGLKYAALGLILNYLIHFLNDYIFSGKYKSGGSLSLISVYGRVVIQQLVILTGGFFTLGINQDENTGRLILLIFLKTLVDLGFYLIRRNKAKEKALQQRDINQEAIL